MTARGCNPCQGAATRATTETFRERGQGQNPKIGKNGKGPSWAPRGPRGARRYPYGSAPTPQLSPRNRIFFPFHLDPNQDQLTFSENPNSTFDDFRQFPSEHLAKLSTELTLNLWGVPRSIRTDLDGYGQPGVPETASQANFNFSRFPVFPCQPLRPAPGRIPTQKFPW